ncbi:MAG: ParB/RepB/Spo0J family partition protein [Candidatus Omnitrophota bacterium]
MEKRGLGRGLGALIPERETEEHFHGSAPKEHIRYLPVEQIKPNPYQPRENFDSQGLEELVASIKEKGIIQPIIVRHSASGYELIAGERRWRAAKSLNLKEIPVIVRQAKDEESLELALIENIQRQNLSPIEEAHAYKHLMEQFGFTQEKIAQTVGKARASVANTLRLLKLPLEIQEMLKKGQLSFGHGKVLLELEDVQKQLALSRQIVSKSLSVRELENLVFQHHKARPAKVVSETRKLPHLEAIEEELRQILGTKVKIASGPKRGTLHIEFYSQDDLERIYNQIRK